MKYQSTGALLDTRPEAEKAKDFQFKEIVASADRVEWSTKPQSQWKTYPIYDQHQTDQCVAFTLAKMMGIQHLISEGEWIDFSKSHLYERRANFPAGGMSGNDAFEIARKEGVTFEILYPTKTKNNNFDKLDIRNHYAQVGSIFKINSYVALPAQDIEVVASTIQRTGKGVMVWFWGTYDEWDRNEPRVLDTSINLFNAPVRHSVTAVDYFLHNGKKCLLIEDSWGNRGIQGRRIISEDFYKKRNYYAGHIMNFDFSRSEEKKTFTITKPLELNQTSDDVVTLQKMLQHEGFFPSNVGTSGFYGQITARAVLEWQLHHNVDNATTLRDLKGHYFGAKSLATVRKLY